MAAVVTVVEAAVALMAVAVVGAVSTAAGVAAAIIQVAAPTAVAVVVHTAAEAAPIVGADPRDVPLRAAELVPVTTAGTADTRAVSRACPGSIAAVVQQPGLPQARTSAQAPMPAIPVQQAQQAAMARQPMANGTPLLVPEARLARLAQHAHPAIPALAILPGHMEARQAALALEQADRHRQV